MGSVDDVLVELVVTLDLRTELRAEELGRVCGSGGEGRRLSLKLDRQRKGIGRTRRRTSERTSNVRHVGHDRLDAVAAALDLGEEDGHLVALRTGEEGGQEMSVSHDAFTKRPKARMRT